MSYVNTVDSNRFGVISNLSFDRLVWNGTPRYAFHGNNGRTRSFVWRSAHWRRFFLFVHANSNNRLYPHRTNIRPEHGRMKQIIALFYVCNMTRLCRAHHLWSEWCLPGYRLRYIYYFNQYYPPAGTDTHCGDFLETLDFIELHTANVVTVNCYWTVRVTHE